MRLRFQITGKWVGTFEGEHENALEIGHGFGGGVDRHGTALPGKAPQIVESHDVVGVRVSENDRIDPADIFAQSLGAEIRSGIDDKGGLGRLDVNGRAQAFIARIGGATDGAIAADHWHALRSPGTEKSESEFGVESCGWRVQDFSARALSTLSSQHSTDASPTPTNQKSRAG